ncbi:hypothetical protein AB6N23_05450 [Cellulomonas sp. 179-A 9B4 NHS]|uniref:hypothetical protein n=1 Tax=Cellulomonas sp. 179-A 9B4 NHS TaxID=3142379 RepID=UPI0039A1577E
MDLFVRPEIDPDDVVLWEGRANWRRRLRPTGGWLTLTRRRLVFTPNRLERLMLGAALDVPLGDAARARVTTGALSNVELEDAGATVGRFLLEEPHAFVRAVQDRAG